MLPFELLIVDVDGVMTDGTKMYDRDGKIFGKSYCDLDFTAIKRFKASGIQVCFLSGDKIINEKMAETRKVDFYHNGPGINKIEFLPQLKNHYKTESIAYVGDDYYDIEIMKAVKISFCPKNSPNIVKKTATYVINRKSGKGVVAGIFDLFEKDIPNVYPKDSACVNPK